MGRLHANGRSPESEGGLPPARSSPDILRDLGALARLSTSLSAGALQEDLELALDILRQATGAEVGEIFLVNPQERCVELTAFRGPFRQAFHQITRFKPGEGFPGLVWLRGEHILTRSLPQDPRYLRTQVKESGFQSYICVPLLSPQGVLGSLNLASRRPEPDLEGALRLLSWASAPLSLALRAGVYRQEAHILSGGTATMPDSKEKAPLPFLEIGCLGPFQLRRHGVPVPPPMAPLQKALTLLKILLTYEGHPLSKDTLIEFLWPEADPEAGSARLHVVLHALRRLVELPTAGRRWLFIQQEDGRYFFNLEGPCYLDVKEFMGLVSTGLRAEAKGGAEAAIGAYEAAIKLYRGDFLEDEPFAEWCQGKREHLRGTCLDVLRRLATLEARVGDWEACLKHLRHALQMEPVQEEVHRELMRCLWDAGRRDEALRQYKTCQELLWRELEVKPLPETQDLAQAIYLHPGNLSSP